MTAVCKTCGAPVDLAPDGDPHYDTMMVAMREATTTRKAVLREREACAVLVDSLRLEGSAQGSEAIRNRRNKDKQP